MQKKVKSLQMFRKPVTSLSQGDRGACCVTQFDPKLLERGLVCSPGVMPTLYAAVVSISKIRYYSGDVRSKGRFHITQGHSTVMSRVTLFREHVPAQPASGGAGDDGKFDFASSYEYVDELEGG